MPDKVTVIGAGTMGHGIAQVAAQGGFEVALYDIREEFVEKGLAKVRENLAKGIEKGKVTPADRDAALARLKGTSDFAAAAAGARLVIEAAPEKMEIKADIFRRLDEAAPRDAVLATNTSSLSISEIAKSTRRGDRICGMHFFNPPHLMKLLEIVRGVDTSDATIAAAREIGAKLGKDCILVKDVPGFASSRLGICIGLEAMRMFEQGVASAEDIDKAMKLGYGFPMGPLELTDLVGLDVRLDIANYLFRELKTEVFRPPEVLKKLVAEGKLGKKTKQGFYKYP
ncbi:MAG: 3-hydroxyacyl-CoA dehydrogenase family protein [Planctomycetes bacterium]|nr:3-hydroxyacyl-CoA dehydrogenase family protein [Planctomycetota bacterium]